MAKILMLVDGNARGRDVLDINFALLQLNHTVSLTHYCTEALTEVHRQHHDEPVNLLIFCHWLPGTTPAAKLFGIFNKHVASHGLKLLNIQQRGPFPGLGVPTACSSVFLPELEKGNLKPFADVIQAALAGEPVPQEA